jgi:2-hydroxychromene-2-carboxylate isomerase
MRIDCFISPVSSYSYLASRAFPELVARHGAEVTYRPVDVAGLFARTGGKLVAERHPSRQEYRQQDLRRRAARLGLPMNLRPMFGAANPAPANYAVIAAQKAGGGDLHGLVAGVLRAVWAEERDISDLDVIAGLLSAHGFDPGVADRHMLAAAETYAANLEEAVGRGVFGLPFYIVGEERFWGQDRLEDLDQFLAGKL